MDNNLLLAFAANNDTGIEQNQSYLRKQRKQCGVLV